MIQKAHWQKRAIKNLFIAGILYLTAGAHAFYGRVINEASSILLHPKVAAAETTTDDAGAREAFSAVANVFIHPRCVNCHPAGDKPLQRDEGRPHAMNVKRGPDGLGEGAAKCGNCHQQTNLAGANMPPGAPGWHLPPPETPMIFENKTAGEICRQIKDPAQNGGKKTLQEIIEHIHTPLVAWGWNPGGGRTPAPGTYQEFVEKITEWIDKGAACPD